MKNIGNFLKTVKFWFVQKTLYNFSKERKNHMQLNLSQVLRCAEKVMGVGLWEERIKYFLF